jgi:N-acetylmuramic acid 6-phosphate (MurNAc-6-P) etherase
MEEEKKNDSLPVPTEQEALVMEKTSCTLEQARKALALHGDDVVRAILCVATTDEPDDTPTGYPRLESNQLAYDEKAESTPIEPLAYGWATSKDGLVHLLQRVQQSYDDPDSHWLKAARDAREHIEQIKQRVNQTGCTYVEAGTALGLITDSGTHSVFASRDWVEHLCKETQ